MSEKMQTKRRTAWEVTVDFTRRTTCHGLDQVTEDGRPIVLRVAWFIAILGLFGGLCWQLTVRVQEYMSWATDTELHEEFDSFVEFPAVSICNYNRFFNITSHEELAAVDGLIRISSPVRRVHNDAAWEKKIRDYYKNDSHIPFLSKEVDDKGWPLNEKTISKCLFTQKTCSHKDFKPFVTQMGRCFTFTSKEKLVQSVPGSGHGLLLSLNIMQDYYSEHPEYGRPEAGIKVHIHEHNEPPMVEEFGVAVPAGHMGHLVIKKEERKLMHKPWGICNPSPKKMTYTDDYTFSECMTECRVQHIVEKCGCKPYWSPTAEKAQECDVWQILKCGGAAEADSLALTPINCSCDQSCHSIIYNHKLSYATFPGIEVGEILAESEHDEEMQKKIDEGDIDSQIKVMGTELNLTLLDPYRLKLGSFRENHLMLDVYFESLSFTKIIQSKKVGEMSLASDFGGLLGLWLGISVVTVLEFFQFIIQLCANYSRPDTTNKRGRMGGNGSTKSMKTKQKVNPTVITVNELDEEPSEEGNGFTFLNLESGFTYDNFSEV
ncbi:bile acid-sensitive ion channel-like isoform X1 [Styela clava]